jgi:acetyltransferase-like isoleucine patch superfamily enzyme
MVGRLPDTALALMLRLGGALGFTPFGLARRYAKQLGVHLGPDVVFFGGISFGSEPWLVRIGGGTWVTTGVQFITHDGATIVVRNGPFGITPETKLNRYGAIAVGENCFIGVRSILLPGTAIGDHCIVGAASVVSGEVPPRTIVAGNPARVVGDVEEFAARVCRDTVDFPASWPDAATMRRVMSEKVWAVRPR